MLDFDSDTAPCPQFQTGPSEPVKKNPSPKEPTVGDKIRHLLKTEILVQEHMQELKAMKYLVKKHPKKYEITGDGSHLNLVEDRWHVIARIQLYSLSRYYE